jgi:hypothetical protein
MRWRDWLLSQAESRECDKRECKREEKPRHEIILERVVWENFLRSRIPSRDQKTSNSFIGHKSRILKLRIVGEESRSKKFADRTMLAEHFS